MDLGWGLRICISIKFPGGADAGVPGTGLPQAILRCLYLSGGVNGKVIERGDQEKDTRFVLYDYCDNRFKDEFNVMWSGTERLVRR